MVYHNIPRQRGIFVYKRGLRILCSVRRKQGGAKPGIPNGMRTPQGGTAAEVSPDGVPDQNHPKPPFRVTFRYLVYAPLTRAL